MMLVINDVRDRAKFSFFDGVRYVFADWLMLRSGLRKIASCQLWIRRPKDLDTSTTSFLPWKGMVRKQLLRLRYWEDYSFWIIQNDGCKTKNLITVVRHNVVLRRTKNNFKTNGYELEGIYSISRLLEEPLLHKTTINFFDVRLNFPKSYTGYAAARCLELTIECLPKTLQVINAVC